MAANSKLNPSVIVGPSVQGPVFSKGESVPWAYWFHICLSVSDRLRGLRGITSLLVPTPDGRAVLMIGLQASHCEYGRLPIDNRPLSADHYP